MNVSSLPQDWSVRRTFAVFSLGVALISGCTSNSGDGTGDTGSSGSGTVAQSSLARDTNPQVADADLAAVVAGNTDFALKAFTLFDPDGGTNTVFSPYSITQALLLTAVGAKGSTLNGIEQALAFKLAQDRLNPAFNKLDLLLKAKTSGAVQADVGQLPHLNIVNAAWGQKDHTFLAAYLDTIALNFGAGLRLMDFAHAPEDARLAINNWVAEQTSQRILNLIQQGDIDADTGLVLTNAIWFKANWAEQFSEQNTKDKPFYRRDGSSSQVPFMRGTFSLSYAQGNGCQAVDIPYADGNLSMLVIMPDAGTFDTFLAGLTPSILGDITTHLGNREIDLSLPKFTFSATPDLGSVLKTLGMADAFDKSRADFLGIDGGFDGKNDLFISKVLHKAFISVDEKGTEAAAATAVIFGVVTAVVGTPPPPPLPLVVDHPFIFLIRDRQTGLILFMGKVVTLDHA